MNLFYGRRGRPMRQYKETIVCIRSRASVQSQTVNIFNFNNTKNLCMTMCARKLQMHSLELSMFVVWMRSAFTGRDIFSSLRRIAPQLSCLSNDI